MNKNLSPGRFLTDYLLGKISDEPLALRILLYRAVAIESAEKPFAEKCHQLAGELEKIEAQHHQLVLDFKRRAEG